LFLPIASNIETDYREGNIVLQADYAWGKPGLLYKAAAGRGPSGDLKAMLLRGGYLGGRAWVTAVRRTRRKRCSSNGT